MKKLLIVLLIGGSLLPAACQNDGNINDTIEEDSVEAIRRPDDNTDVEKLVDTPPAVNRYDSSLQKEADTNHNDNGRNK